VFAIEPAFAQPTPSDTEQLQARIDAAAEAHARDERYRGLSPKDRQGLAEFVSGKAPLVVRWPGHIRPGTVKNQMFSALDWVPTFVDIAGGPKGDGLKKQIEAGQYPGIVKTTLDGFDQRDYLEGTSEKSARDVFFYYTGSKPSAVRYKNWKMYYVMVPTTPTGAMLGAQSYSWTMVDNIMRDPFEIAGGLDDLKSMMSSGGALASPSTAYIYDWNMLPLGQALWLKELQTYKLYPPLQAPEAYNLDGIIAEMKASRAASHAGQ
jgi:arylsulfatase